jgi:hypothetical protein
VGVAVPSLPARSGRQGEVAGLELLAQRPALVQHVERLGLRQIIARRPYSSFALSPHN